MKLDGVFKFEDAYSKCREYGLHLARADDMVTAVGLLCIFNNYRINDSENFTTLALHIKRRTGSTLMKKETK